MILDCEKIGFVGNQIGGGEIFLFSLGRWSGSEPPDGGTEAAENLNMGACGGEGRICVSTRAIEFVGSLCCA